MKKISFLSIVFLLIFLSTALAGPPGAPPGYGPGDDVEFGSVSAATAKFTTGAGAGKVFTSDADGDGTWESAPSGTVPSSGTSTTAIMVGDGSGSWDVVEAAKIVTAIDSPGYWYNGVDGAVIVDDGTAFEPGEDDFSIMAIFYVDSITDQKRILSKRSGTNGYELNFSGSQVELFAGDGVTYTSPNSNDILPGWHVAVGVIDKPNYSTIYVDGILGEVRSTTISGAITGNTATLRMGMDSASVYTSIGLYRVAFFNVTLSSDDVAMLSVCNQIPYKYQGASQTELTSGTLTVGKAYRLKDWITDDDFTNVGASSNADGVEFIATGTTPTTWTNSSTVVQIGCVANYGPSGVGHNIWADNSGNELHGTVSGALPVNLPTDHREKYIDLAVTGDTSFTFPEGYIIDSIVLTSDGAVGGGIDIGTTNGGGEIVTAQAISGAGTVLCTLVDGAAYNTTGADDTIYITDADGSGWDSATVGVRVQMERIALN